MTLTILVAGRRTKIGVKLAEISQSAESRVFAAAPDDPFLGRTGLQALFPDMDLDQILPLCVRQRDCR